MFCVCAQRKIKPVLLPTDHYISDRKEKKRKFIIDTTKKIKKNESKSNERKKMLGEYRQY